MEMVINKIVVEGQLLFPTTIVRLPTLFSLLLPKNALLIYLLGGFELITLLVLG